MCRPSDFSWSKTRNTQHLKTHTGKSNLASSWCTGSRLWISSNPTDRTVRSSGTTSKLYSNFPVRNPAYRAFKTHKSNLARQTPSTCLLCYKQTCFALRQHEILSANSVPTDAACAKEFAIQRWVNWNVESSCQHLNRRWHTLCRDVSLMHHSSSDGRMEEGAVPVKASNGLLG